jgi:hypothetical protein
MFSHEASIIATKERAEMKMIEFFIARKLSALGIQSQSAVTRKACSNRRWHYGRINLSPKCHSTALRTRWHHGFGN